MIEAVTDVLQLRAVPETGFGRSVSGSVLAHALGLVLLFVGHYYVVTHRTVPPKVMTITLGGSEGPRTTGMTAAGRRPTDEVAPQPKHEPSKVASSQEDVMTLPIKSQPKPTKEVENLPISSMPRPPTVGSQVQSGNTRMDTGSTSLDKGLTIGGGGGSSATLDVKEFCCPEYLTSLLRRIESKWDKNVRERGKAVLAFKISRDGTITFLQTDEATSPFLEMQSLAALQKTGKVDPLPAEFPGDHLTIHLTFPYGPH